MLHNSTVIDTNAFDKVQKQNGKKKEKLHKNSDFEQIFKMLG